MLYNTEQVEINPLCIGKGKNSESFILIHCMTMSKSSMYMNYKGEKLPAFKAEKDIVNFLKNSLSITDYKVSCHILILQDGTRIQFGKSKEVMYHAGKGHYDRYHGNLNRRSVGIELVRDYDKPVDKQYTEDQYKSLAEYCLLFDELGISDITYHYMTAPERKTDPDNFDVGLFEYIYSNMLYFTNDLDIPFISVR